MKIWAFKRIEIILNHNSMSRRGSACSATDAGLKDSLLHLFHRPWSYLCESDGMIPLLSPHLLSRILLEACPPKIRRWGRMRYCRWMRMLMLLHLMDAIRATRWHQARKLLHSLVQINYWEHGDNQRLWPKGHSCPINISAEIEQKVAFFSVDNSAMRTRHPLWCKDYSLNYPYHHSQSSPHLVQAVSSS